MAKNMEPNKDDALFEALGKNKKRKKRKILITVGVIVLVLAVALTGMVMSLRKKVLENFGGSTAEVLSYAAQIGTISTTVSGSGSLTEVDLESLTVPEGVLVKDIEVEQDDVVEQGDLLATVDMASVLSTMSSVQGELEALDKEISDASGDTVNSNIKAGVSGRVKRIYAEKGDSVVSVMAEHGALAVISLDGYMALDIETDSLTAGDTVTVARQDGTRITGTVESSLGGKATILVTDNGPAYDEAVTILDSEGNELGSGNLYIHAPLAITGYAGTIAAVSVGENTKVTTSSTLFMLKDTATSANYDSLLRDREALEEELLELLTIYRDGAVLAPFSGKVSTVDYSDEMATSLVTMTPNIQMSVTISIDETDILALELGQEAEVTVSSVSDRPFSGVVTEISKTATTSSGVSYYSAVVTLDKEEKMLAGMSASVDVKIEGVEDAILIPVDALHQTRNFYYVYTSYDEEAKTYGDRVEVTIGMQNSKYVVIESGLNVGDTVYYTESTSASNFFGMMGGMGGMSGMPDMGGMSGGFPGGSSGGFPGGSSGGFPGGSGSGGPGGGSGRPSGSGGRGQGGRS